MNPLKYRYYIGAFRKNTNILLDITPFYHKELVENNYAGLCFQMIFDSKKDLTDLEKVEFRIMNTKMKDLNEDVRIVFDNAMFVFLNKYDNSSLTEAASFSLHLAIKDIVNYSNNTYFQNKFVKGNRIDFVANKIKTTFNGIVGIDKPDMDKMFSDLIECYQFVMDYALKNEYYECASNTQKLINRLK